MDEQEKRKFIFQRLSVSFDSNVKVLYTHVWLYLGLYAYRTVRIGSWKQEYLNRKRFQKKIRDFDKVLSPILSPEHRKNTFNRNETYMLTNNNKKLNKTFRF